MHHPQATMSGNIPSSIKPEIQPAMSFKYLITIIALLGYTYIYLTVLLEYFNYIKKVNSRNGRVLILCYTACIDVTHSLLYCNPAETRRGFLKPLEALHTYDLVFGFMDSLPYMDINNIKCMSKARQQVCGI